MEPELRPAPRWDPLPAPRPRPELLGCAVASANEAAKAGSDAMKRAILIGWCSGTSFSKRFAPRTQLMPALWWSADARGETAQPFPCL
eukprot:1148414-Pelagomonas_calceolata.AAC.2